MTILLDAHYYLNVIYIGITLMATITLGIAQREYKPLKLWFYGSIFLSIGSIFGLIGIDEIDYQIISYGLYIVAILFLMSSILKEYRELKQTIITGKSIVPLLGKSAIFIPISLLDATPNISFDSFLNPVVLVEIVLFLFLIASSILCYQIYRVKRNPTHFFIMLSLIFAIGTDFVTILDSLFSTIWSQTFSDAISIVFAVMLFTTGLVSKIETSMIRNQKLILMQKKMEEILATNKGISERLTVSAEELSSSAEEISSSCSNIASSQQQISKGASNQVAAITETQRKFSRLTQGIGQIREKVQNINVISDLIHNIADQTNMLALNAAIEAARAGDAGRGFNVVAEQVRKLAEESRKSVSNTTKFLIEINKITNEQEASAFEILKDVDAIASVAEETSASTEQSAAAAEQLASSMSQITNTSQDLLFSAEQMMNKYKTMDEEKLDELNSKINLINQPISVIEESISQSDNLPAKKRSEDVTSKIDSKTLSSKVKPSLVIDLSNEDSF